MEFSNPAKLRLESLSQHFVLRAPASPGTSKMAFSTLNTHLGKLLREAGHYLCWVSAVFCSVSVCMPQDRW